MSASIATTNLVFSDDYHLVDWAGNVGSDMFKALVQFGAGEAALIGVTFIGEPIIIGALVVVAVYGLIEWSWGKYKISNHIIEALEYVISE